VAAPAAAAPAGSGAVRPGGAPRGSFRGKFGVFADAAEACVAAQESYLQLAEKGVAGRVRAIEIVKGLCDSNAAEWGRIELEETKIGRLDHKIEKLKSQRGSQAWNS
jgi:aldehyde dehydrogenase